MHEFWSCTSRGYHRSQYLAASVSFSRSLESSCIFSNHFDKSTASTSTFFFWDGSILPSKPTNSDFRGVLAPSPDRLVPGPTCFQRIRYPLASKMSVTPNLGYSQCTSVSFLTIDTAFGCPNNSNASSLCMPILGVRSRIFLDSPDPPVCRP